MHLHKTTTDAGFSHDWIREFSAFNILSIFRWFGLDEASDRIERI